MWRLAPTLELARSLLPSLDVNLSNLKYQLMAATGKPVDHVYSRLGLLNGMFFPQGWGDLGVVNFEQDISLMAKWPPPGMKIEWRKVDEGLRDAIPFRLYEGTFKTPCVDRVYDALPPESRIGRVRLLVPPGGPSATTGATDSGHPEMPSLAAPAAVIHLAATGDQGFNRRLYLGFPLLKYGISSVVLESPYYGARRPPAQKGTKLLRVSDLMALGWATIYESMNLLQWLKVQGFDEGGLGMAGLSMGGVHACMTTALYPGPLACAALLAPRSAAVAYVDGALGAAMAWEPLLRDVDERSQPVKKVIYAASQPVSVMREATYALAELELAWENAVARQAEMNTGSISQVSPATAMTSPPLPTRITPHHVIDAGPSGNTHAAGQRTSENQKHNSPLESSTGRATLAGIQQQVRAIENAASWIREGSLDMAAAVLKRVTTGPHQRNDSATDTSTGAVQKSDGKNIDAGQHVKSDSHHSRSGRQYSVDNDAAYHGLHTDHNRHQDSQTCVVDEAWGLTPAHHALHHTHHHQPQQHAAHQGGSSGHSAQALHSHSSHQPHTSQQISSNSNGSQQDSSRDLQHTLQGNAGSTTEQGSQASGRVSPPAVSADRMWRAQTRGAGGADETRSDLNTIMRGLSELIPLSRSDEHLKRQKTLRRLKNVLETYTDITRFPVPQRPDAAVFVAATHDAYVTVESVHQLADYWKGSELRRVTGGHVTAFLLHQGNFRKAIADSIFKLRTPPASGGA